jgi:plasmid maintenance system antidote protein VapI
LTVKTAIKLEKKTSKDAEYWLTEQMKEELKKYR